MIKRLAALGLVLLHSTGVSAQEPFNIAVRVDKLATLFTQLYGPGGLIVDSRATLPSGDDHSAHFNSAFETEFARFGAVLTGKLVSVPLPSLASGLTYEFDPTLGVFSRSTQSFGPIMAERADTIGANRTSFGVAYEHSRFDTIEGVNLDSVPAVFTHDGFELGGGRGDLVTTRNAIDARVDQFTTFVTYGLTDRLDVSLAVPFVSNELLVVSEATIQRIGTENPEIHFYRMLDGSVGDTRIFTAFGSASGIGDLTIRLKGRIWKGSTSGIALGLDLRVPTGDEENLLGAGAPGVKPFVAWSASYDAFSPHVNFGYVWNGSSILAGDPVTVQSADLPDQVTYIVGAEFGVSSRLTFAFDVLGLHVIDSPRLVQQDFLAQDGTSVTGETVSHVLGGVLRIDPDWSSLPGATPEAVHRLLRRSLQKVPKQRIHDVADVRLDLEEAATAKPTDDTAVMPVGRPAIWRQALPLALGTLTIGSLVTGLLMWNLRPAAPPRSPARFVVSSFPNPAPVRSSNETELAISPDGSVVVYGATVDDEDGLYVRHLDRLEGEFLTAMANTGSFFFSPDGAQVGFFTRVDQTFKRIPVSGGGAITLCALPDTAQPRGASWGPDDTIIFARSGGGNGLFRVSAAGGEPERLTMPDSPVRHYWPEVLPSGRAVLFTIVAGGADTPEEMQIAVLDLETGKQRVLLESGAHPRYVSSGHLVYSFGNTLRAVGFGAERFDIVGDPIPVLEGIPTGIGGGLPTSLLGQRSETAHSRYRRCALGTGRRVRIERTYRQ